MRTPIVFVIVVASVISTIAGCVGGSASNDPQTNVNSQTNSRASSARRTLRAFRSEQEIAGYFREIARERERFSRRRDATDSVTSSNSNMAGMSNAPPSPSSSAQAEARSTADGDESVTNVQHAGVDEGGIVKLHGDHLVALRRGRLFTVRIGDGEMRPVSVVDAFGPGINPRGAWYDEMLISGDTIAVIGYSYERGGTEIGLFQIDAGGNLNYRSTYHLRSNDYYSSRNYASRLIGGRLIFYTPSYSEA